MTPIVCSDCGEVSLETSRTVVLPFVCAGCEKQYASYEEIPVDDPRLTSHHDADPSDCHTAPDVTVVEQPTYEDENGKTWNYNLATGEWDIPVLAEGTPTLSDDTATTDATVELISDLESQLAVAKELSQARTELIEQLEKQNGSLRQQVDSLKAASRVLIDASPFLIEVASALAFHYGYATAHIKHLEHKNEVLEEGIGFRDTLIRVLQEYGGIDLVVTQS